MGKHNENSCLVKKFNDLAAALFRAQNYNGETHKFSIDFMGAKNNVSNLLKSKYIQVTKRWSPKCTNFLNTDMNMLWL